MSTRAERGFTLVEVLAVLALTGMIAVLLLQMLGVFVRGFEQAGRIQGRLAEDAMRFHWFRETISVMAASLDAEFAFRGDDRRLSGYTMAPLLGRQGELTRVEWSVQDTAVGSALWYREGQAQAIRIGSWPDARMEFAYRGQASGWQTEWPAGDLPEGVLPYRVKLAIAGSEAGNREVYAAINVRRTGRFDYRDLIN